MHQFKTGDRVVFRESETGEASHGFVEEVLPEDDQYPNGGLILVRIDDDYSIVEAFWPELTPEPDSDSL